MARLRDVAPVLESFGTWAFLKRVWQQVNEDGIFVWASALAYSWLFACFPFLIFLMSLVPLLPLHTQKTASNVVADVVHHTLPAKAVPIIMDNIDAVMNSPGRKGLLSIGLIVTLWAASGGMSMTMAALDQCYDIEHGRPYYKQRPMAIALTIVVTIFVLAVLVLMPIGTLVEQWLQSRGHLVGRVSAWAFDLARYGLAMVLMLAILAVTYYFGPSIRQKFQPISPGAVFSICIWVLLDLAFRFYIDRFGRYEKTYGTVGGVAILLLFFYIDALVLLIGAEINSEIDFEILGVPQGSKDFTGPAKNDPLPADSVEPASA